MSKVIIGCKLPTGFRIERGMPGDSDYLCVIVKGANDGEVREGGLFVAHTVGGFGRTEVEGAVWAAWKTGADITGAATYDPRTGAELMSAKAMRESLVKARKAIVDEWQSKGLVFEVDTVDAALAQANDKATVRTGFEPLAQAADPRNKSGVEKAA